MIFVGYQVRLSVVPNQRVFFSPNIEQNDKEALSAILGFQSTNCLGKYLGFPIIH